MADYCLKPDIQYILFFNIYSAFLAENPFPYLLSSVFGQKLQPLPGMNKTKYGHRSFLFELTIKIRIIRD